MSPASPKFTIYSVPRVTINLNLAGGWSESSAFSCSLVGRGARQAKADLGNLLGVKTSEILATDVQP